ncbi:MAG: hypothetical protein WCP74_08365 [Sphingobacteriia bacterium]
MKFESFAILFLFQIAVSQQLKAQQYLPYFSVIHLSKSQNKISWNNPNKNCIQLSVQRSTDSLNNFRTILSAQSPQLAENGFIDKKALEGVQLYYRIFYTLKGGAYFFSKTVSPVEVKDNIAEKKTPSKSSNKNNKANKKSEETNKLLKSSFLKMDKKGNLILHIPKTEQFNYSITFYSAEKNKFLSIDPIPETDLLIEKGNFLKEGWFEYELKEAGKIIERKRFYIQ